MSNITNYLQGKCKEMCPQEEIKMREKEKLLHMLEMVPGTEKSKFPKASKKHMVKAFCRSAAGKQIDKENNLRPPKVLLKTVSYLLCDVIATKKLAWHSVYDFITDRLMAVRQDMVVQNISKAESITILQPIVRFHAYAAYKLCHESVANFDPTLNNSHLQECLKRLLHFYDGCNNYLYTDINPTCNDYIVETRPEFEALYIIFNLGNDEPLRRVLSIPDKCKTELVKNALKLSLCYRCGNFTRLCRLIKNLPPLLRATASLHLPQVRRKTLQIMSTAYHSKNLAFPTKVLKDILLYGTTEELLQDCKYYGITGDKECIYLTKQSFDVTKTAAAPRHESLVNSKYMDENLQSIILG